MPLSDGQKYDDMYIRLDTVSTLNKRTDGRTDGVAKTISCSRCIACWRAI